MILRFSLGTMYLYSGYNLVAYPSAWYWVLPYWLREIIVQVIHPDTYVRMQGVLEIFMALVLLAWFVKPPMVKLVSLLSTLEFLIIFTLALIPFSEANFLITFRDIGLFGAALALLIITFSQNLPKEIQDKNL